MLKKQGLFCKLVLKSRGLWKRNWFFTGLKKDVATECGPGGKVYMETLASCRETCPARQLAPSPVLIRILACFMALWNILVLYTIILQIAWKIECAYPAPLRFVFNTSRLSAGVIDMDAMHAAASTLSDIFRVVSPVDPATIHTFDRYMYCDPFLDEPIEFNPQTLSRGQIMVYLYSYSEQEVWKCKVPRPLFPLFNHPLDGDAFVVSQGSVAFTSICSSISGYNMPVAASVTVCKGKDGALDYASSVPEFRYRAYMHELIHVLGFMEPSITSMKSAIAGLDGMSILDPPLVVDWARSYSIPSSVMLAG